MSKTAVAAPSEVEEQTEQLRQLVIAARDTPDVAAEAEACLARLNALYAADPTRFSAEDVRWVNVLRGTLGVRLAAHGPQPAAKPALVAKRKGDKLDHCWRCQTPVDERFTAICPDCDSKAYHWRVCPVCQACGCQRDGKVLV
jgi:hypothetical protein